MVRIVVQTPFWQRYALSEAQMDHMVALREAVKPEIQLRLHAVISEDEYIEMCFARLYIPIMTANLPLGRKGNVGMRYNERSQPDGVLMLGSDDFIDEAYLRAAVEALQAGIDIWGVADIYFYRPDTKAMIHWPGYPASSPRYGEPIGAGRMLSRKFLDACDWAPWAPNQSAAMDFSMMETFKSLAGLTLGTTTLASIGAFMCDVKTGTNQTGWASLANHPEAKTVDPAQFAWMTEKVDNL